MAPLFSHGITQQYQKKITHADLVHTYVNRLPAKYLPGGIWHSVARGHDLLKRGLNKKQLSILFFYENFWPVVITSFIGGSGVIFYHQGSFWRPVALFLVSTSIITILLLILNRKKKWVFPVQTYLTISLISIMFWLIAAFSFISYLAAFKLVSFNIIYISDYIFSWLIGFLSFFSPQGIGVFELTLTQLATFPVSPKEAMIIIAGFRFIVFISDVSVWIFYHFYQRVKLLPLKHC